MCRVRSTSALTMLFLMAMAGAAPAQEIGKGLVVILVGAPESGKSTQAAFIRERYQIPVIAIDDLVKENSSAFRNRLAKRSRASTSDMLLAIPRETRTAPLPLPTTHRRKSSYDIRFGARTKQASNSGC